MKTLTSIGVLSITLVLPTTHRVVAQTTTPEMLKVWTMTSGTDKLTDKMVFTSTATVRVSDNSPLVYQFTMKCDGTVQGVTISAFDGSRPRLIPWETLVSQSGGEVTSRDATTGAPRRYAPLVQTETVTKSFRYRIDSDEVNDATLTQRYTNGGDVGGFVRTSMFRHVPKMPPSSDGRIDIKSFNDAINDSYEALPQARLLIADVFPGETVEIPFGVLTQDARSAMQKMCFKSSGADAVATRHDAEQARAAKASATNEAALTEAIEQQCRPISLMPAEGANVQVQAGGKWVPLSRVWSQVQCASPDALRAVLGTPSITNVFDSSTAQTFPEWLYHTRMGNLLTGYHNGSVGFYIVNGLALFWSPFGSSAVQR